ncbi:sensor histidine kinase [Streptomyces sp. NPDC050738]|uniref:sensor histidine kinase n=1 Tax=Streptomyces sp. NPDC050738 TaxID=3154744 RepID=UPI00343CA81B
MSSRPAPLPVVMRDAWEASRYLLTGIPIAVACMLCAFGMVTAMGFALIGIGFATWPEVVRLLRKFADLERGRAAGRLGVPLPEGEQHVPLVGGAAARVRLAFTDPGTWRIGRWLLAQTLYGMLFGYVAMLVWPLALIVEPVVLGPVHLYDRRRADEYGIEPPERKGLLLRWLPVLADLGAEWTSELLRPLPPSESMAQRIAQLTESRAGAVEAHGAELRRIERDLHDGAQARIVALSLRIGLAKQLLDRDPAGARLRLDEAQDGAEAALAELRHGVRGIHPPVLTDRGLAGAVRALAADVSVPVDVELAGVQDGRRLPAAIEAAAYFVVAEALTNISKHSGADRARVRIAREARTLRVIIGDDGRGGADEGAGSGLVGIRRRVAALDGTTRIASPVGGPTEIEVELPCAS